MSRASTTQVRVNILMFNNNQVKSENYGAYIFINFIFIFPIVRYILTNSIVIW